MKKDEPTPVTAKEAQELWESGLVTDPKKLLELGGFETVTESAPCPIRTAQPLDEEGLQRVLEGIVDTIHNAQDRDLVTAGELEYWAKSLPEFGPARPVEGVGFGECKQLLVKVGGTEFLLVIYKP